MTLRVALLGLLTTASAVAGPSLTSQTPVSNFRLPTFTKDGHRSMLIQGGKAVVADSQIELAELNLTLFDGSAKDLVDTIIISPRAVAELDTETIGGDSAVRVIRDDLEITGEKWSYDHRQKKVSIGANARIAFAAQLPDLLK